MSVIQGRQCNILIYFELTTRRTKLSLLLKIILKERDSAVHVIKAYFLEVRRLFQNNFYFLQIVFIFSTEIYYNHIIILFV